MALGTPPARWHRAGMIRWGRTRTLLAAAAVAAVLALALPWTSPVSGSYTPGWWVPGTCITTYDLDGWPSIYCTTGAFGWSSYLPGYAAITGSQTPVRVLLAAVVVLVLLARRRRSRPAALAALVAAAAGLALGGLLPLPGQIAYLAGMALLGLALRADGLLGRSPGSPGYGLARSGRARP